MREDVDPYAQPADAERAPLGSIRHSRIPHRALDRRRQGRTAWQGPFPERAAMLTVAASCSTISPWPYSNGQTGRLSWSSLHDPSQAPTVGRHSKSWRSIFHPVGELPLSETEYCCSNLGVNEVDYAVLEPYARAPTQHSSCL